MQPYEIIGAPLTMWLAPTGTAFPLIDAAPAVDWVQVGTNGSRNYSEEGVTVSHMQSNNFARPAGATGPVKAFLDTEDLKFRLTVWDVTLEQYGFVLNGNALSTVAAGVGTAGYKKLGLSRSIAITEYALLVRGFSPYDESMNMQYEVPRCMHVGSPEPVFAKAKPAGLVFEFQAMEDLNAASDDERFGRIIAQHQAALP